MIMKTLWKSFLFFCLFVCRLYCMLYMPRNSFLSVFLYYFQPFFIYSSVHFDIVSFNEPKAHGWLDWIDRILLSLRSSIEIIGTFLHIWLYWVLRNLNSSPHLWMMLTHYAILSLETVETSSSFRGKVSIGAPLQP